MTYPDKDPSLSQEEHAFRQLFIEAARKNFMLMDDVWPDLEAGDEERANALKNRLQASVALLTEGAMVSYFMHTQNIYSLRRLLNEIDQTLTTFLTEQDMVKVDHFLALFREAFRPSLDNIGLELWPLTWAIMVVVMMMIPDEFYDDVNKLVTSSTREAINKIFRGQSS